MRNERSTPCAMRLLAVKSSLPTVIRTGSRKNESANRRTASGHVALTILRASNVKTEKKRVHDETYTSKSVALHPASHTR
jgi:hypothetical protein